MERLDKFLASRLKISRKDARGLVREGAVLVNGVKAHSGDQKLEGGEAVFAGGVKLDAQDFVYYMMNKPAGIISSTTDPERETVIGLLPRELRRKGLFPAGRLDMDTEGFMLITDDGAFAHRILSPKNRVPKKYYARLDGTVQPGLAEAFAKGLELGGGDICSPAELTAFGDGSEAELVIYEGMYHQVKRMFAKFGLTVIYLKRIQIGGLKLDEKLPAGGVRKILDKELKLIL